MFSSQSSHNPTQRGLDPEPPDPVPGCVAAGLGCLSSDQSECSGLQLPLGRVPAGSAVPDRACLGFCQMYRGWDPPDHQAVPLPLAVHQPPTVQPAHPRHPLSSNLNWTFFSFAVVFPLTYGLNEAFRRRETARRFIFRRSRVHVAYTGVHACCV